MEDDLIKRDLIFGVDIFKGSPRSKKEQEKYSLAVLAPGSGLEEYREISRFKLFRMIKQKKPNILAVDNIYELAKDKKHLLSFLKRLPYETKLIQVTNNQKLSKIASDYNLSFDKKSSLESATVCALLASRGVGYEVSYISDRTKIRVSRSRSLGKGGWSQNRYRRKVHGMVKLKVKEIKDYLDKKGIEYSLTIKEGYGGYTSGLFLVEDNITNIGISSERGSDVQVNLSPIAKDSLGFERYSKNKKYLIVGIDPGTTAAIALLDLDGNVVNISSSRNTSVAKMIKYIRERGKPVVISTDVYPVPDTVEKIKRAFNTMIYSSKDTATEDKINLTKGFNFNNVHERDALFAALDAHKKFKNKFEKIDKEIPIWVDSDEIKAAVLKGESLKSAIYHPLNSTNEVYTKKNGDDAQNKNKDVRKQSDEQVNLQINKIREENEYLRKTLKEKNLEIKKLEDYIHSLKIKERREIKKDKEIKIRDNEIKRQGQEIIKLKEKIKEYSNQIEQFRRIKILESSGDFYPVKVIETFKKESITEFNAKIGIKRGDIVYFKDATGGGRSTADFLINFGIKAVIVGSEMSHLAKERFYEREVPLFNDSEVNIKVDLESMMYVQEFGIIDKNEMDRLVDLWIKKNHERLEERKMEDIIKMINEYKRERGDMY